MPSNHLDRNQLLELMTGFQDACVLGAAAELDLFTLLADSRQTAAEVARQLSADPRGVTILLDAAAAVGLLEKQSDRYQTPPSLRPWLAADSPTSVLPMVLHRMNMMRGWAQLASAAVSGEPVARTPSIRGADADRAAFVAAMHTVSQPGAAELVEQLGPPRFAHLLDVGGASGTWTLAFLQAVPGSRATIFDLPDAIEQARARIADTALADRITLRAGDFYTDPLPTGADFAWVSAIAHQHGRPENRDLFAKVHAALVPGGRIALRDVVMEPGRTQPVAGALFAINMLVNTESGATFTFDEFVEDLQAAGFFDAAMPIRDEAMNSVIVAVK